MSLSETTLPALPRGIARWRLLKLPVAEIRARLVAAGLPVEGTKSIVAARLHDYVSTLPPPSPAGDPPGNDSSGESVADASGGAAPDARRQRLSSRDARAAKAPRCRRSRAGNHAHSRRRHRRSRRTRSRSRSPSSSSSEAGSRSASPSGSSSELSSASRPSSVSPSPPRGRRSRHGRHEQRGRRHSRRRHRGSGRNRSRSSGYRREQRRQRRHDRRLGLDLPPIPERIREKIRRGEYVHLSMLLQANLAATRETRSECAPERARTLRESASISITDFTGWSEAWSLYSAVLASFYPHVAPRLFQYQHFLALKSRAFRASAWLRYDREFRLKVAVNRSWHYEVVDTELWASCFAADSLASAAPAPAGTLTCYTCGSGGHLYAQCPLRRQSGGPRAPLRSEPPLAPAAVAPATAPSSWVQPRPPPGAHEPCMIYNDRGRCFRGPRCPYTHACLSCGGPHAKRVCPALRT